MPSLMTPLRQVTIHCRRGLQAARPVRCRGSSIETIDPALGIITYDCQNPPIDDGMANRAARTQFSEFTVDRHSIRDVDGTATMVYNNNISRFVSKARDGISDRLYTSHVRHARGGFLLLLS